MQLSEDRLSDPTRFDPLQIKDRHAVGWLIDVCGDAKPERLLYRYSDRRLSCFDWNGSEAIWSLEIPPEVAYRQFQFDPKQRRLITKDLSDDSTLSVIDTESGKLLTTIRQRDERLRTWWPLLLPPANGKDERVAIPTDNGVLIRSLGESAEETSVANPHIDFDPRGVRKYPVGLLHSRQTIIEMIVYHATRLAAFVLMFLLPGWYVWHSIRNPRWSLRWLMLGPLVAMLSLSIWYSNWLNDQLLVELILTGGTSAMGLLGTWRAIRAPRTDGKLLTSICLVSLIGFFAIHSVEPLRPSGVRYELSLRDALILLPLFMLSSGTLLVIGRLFWSPRQTNLEAANHG